VLARVCADDGKMLDALFNAVLFLVFLVLYVVVFAITVIAFIAVVWFFLDCWAAVANASHYYREALIYHRRLNAEAKAASSVKSATTNDERQ